MQRSKTLAFTLLASISASFLAGSAAPTPLYAVYQAAHGGGLFMTAREYGIAVIVLAAFALLGTTRAARLGPL
jgi:hypothetical protein